MSRRVWKTGLECGRGGASVCVWQESHGNEGQEQEGSSPAGRWRCSACGRVSPPGAGVVSWALSHHTIRLWAGDALPASE